MTIRASTPNELIDALGGNSPVGEALGVTGQAVSNWRVRGFPAWACSRLQQAADAASVQYDEGLFETRARGRAA